MSFWKKLVEFFVGPEPDPKAPQALAGTPLEKAVWSACLVRIQRGEQFTPLDIATDATASSERTVQSIQAAQQALHLLHDRGLLKPHGYTRTMVATAAGSNWVYHPTSVTVGAPASPASSSGTTSAPRGAPTARASSPTSIATAPRDPYDLGVFLTLSPDELRARSLKINPYQTAWIGRTDVIPPESDERTALIDRGLELRGFLSRDELVEIHRVGNLWLRHRDAVRLAESLAQRNVEEALAQRRIAAQLEKQRKKDEAAAKRAARAEAIERRKRDDIVYLGREVSKGLADRRSHVEKLTELGLPILATPADLASALGVEIKTLRFLAFHADAQRHTHYVSFEVPKRNGGVRLLSAPKAQLAKAQEWILENVLEKLPVERNAHGFVKGRSTVTNAQKHAGKAIVIQQDLVDFFPTITFPRVRGVFQGIGYSPAVATILALLCTESPRAKARYGGFEYHVATGPRALPQGACTSPALSNQVARKLDRRLHGYCAKHGFTYTRYADDLAFSAGPDGHEHVAKLLATLHHVARGEGFTIHPDKGRIQRAGKRQSVTGIIVNEPHKLGLPREEVRRLRAILHNAQRTGLSAQNRERVPTFEAWLRGKIAYLQMVDRGRGEAFRAIFDRLDL